MVAILQESCEPSQETHADDRLLVTLISPMSNALHNAC
jgi:hypothetical protein